MALQDAERRRDAMLGAAVGAWNKKATRLQSEREEARSLMDGLIAESKAKEEEHRARMEKMAPWQMALSSGASGAAIGSAINPGLGTAIGAGIGALGGLAFGAAAPEAVGGVAPYIGMAGQAAQAYQGQQAQSDFMKTQTKQRQDYIDFLKKNPSSLSAAYNKPKV